jgi:hypothetical protein
MTERVRAVRAPGQANSVTLSARLHGRQPGRYLCRALVTAELVSSDSGYTNRPPRLALARQKHSAQVGNVASRPDILGRAVDGMRPALRAYKQRAQRRASVHAWLAARAALGGNERYEDEVRTPASRPVKLNQSSSQRMSAHATWTVPGSLNDPRYAFGVAAISAAVAVCRLSRSSIAAG